MVNLIQIVILSIIQGITEWFPISSSGHLAIFQNFFGFQSISFDVFLHLAGVLAIIFIFWKDIIQSLRINKRENLRYLLLIILGIIPAGLIGFLYKNQIENFFSSMYYLGIFFIISGILVFLTKFFNESKNEANNEKRKVMSWFDSLFIGAFQAIAILPGISRSGATISSGIFRGLKKQEAIKFSFIMAIPVILGASLLELKDLTFSKISYGLLIISFVITFIISIFTIKILLRVLKSDKFYLFGIYNIVVGILILIYSLLIYV